MLIYRSKVSGGRELCNSDIHHELSGRSRMTIHAPIESLGCIHNDTFVEVFGFDDVL